jgi:hypothetical protein
MGPKAQTGTAIGWMYFLFGNRSIVYQLNVVFARIRVVVAVEEAAACFDQSFPTQSIPAR